MNFLNQIRKPRLSDIVLISIDLTSEFIGIDSERDLFRKLASELYSKIERGVHSRRKRDLFSYRELTRKNIAKIISSNDFYIVDSMPLDICKLS